jgi:hypothetical protein
VTRLIAGCAAAALLLSGCAAFHSSDPLAETADRLGDIRSGVLELRLATSAGGGEETGFTLRGPFALPDDDSLPTARLRFRSLEDPGSEMIFTSTGDAAFLDVSGQTYELPDEQTRSLVGAARAGDHGPFDEMDVAQWVTDERLTEAGETTRVRGDLDVVAALNDIFGIARYFGGSDLQTIDDQGAVRVRRAVRSARLDLITGTDDHLLRELTIKIEMGAKAPAHLGSALEQFLGVSFEMHMTIQHPNEPVEVSAPTDALPFESLVGG